MYTNYGCSIFPYMYLHEQSITIDGPYICIFHNSAVGWPATHIYNIYTSDISCMVAQVVYI